MKFQKSPFPYLLLLLFLLVGLPILDYKVDKNLVLEYEIELNKMDHNPHNINTDREKLVTQALVFSFQKR